MPRKPPSPEITSIADLTFDPNNARLHDVENLSMIERSLQEVGAARSIVIDEHGVILAGNGVIEVAGQIGIENVQVVDADGDTIIAVRRSNLTPEQKERLALLDNRAAELGSWNLEVLQTLSQERPGSVRGIFRPDQLLQLLRPLAAPPAWTPVTPSDEPPHDGPYTPNLTPTTSTAPVTAKQVETRAGELERRYTEPPVQVTLVCPHCGGEYFVDKGQV